jgi:hypothetical protein
MSQSDTSELQVFWELNFSLEGGGMLDMDPENYGEYEFTATIKLSPKDLREADGDVAQAIQNVVGRTGACVVEVID